MAAANHNHRWVKVDNANAKHSDKNHYSGAGWKNPIEYIKNRLNRLNVVTRSDSVIAIEYMLTASPEFFKKKGKDGKTEPAISQKKFNAWVKKNKQFLEKKHGKQNIVSFAVHMDESSPHIHCLVLPLSKQDHHQAVEGKSGKSKVKRWVLSAKNFLGGRAKLRDLQTDYANDMGEFGLERGRQLSTAKHEHIRSFYYDLNRVLDKRPELTKRLKNELSEIERKAKDVKDSVFTTFAKASLFDEMLDLVTSTAEQFETMFSAQEAERLRHATDEQKAAELIKILKDEIHHLYNADELIAELDEVKQENIKLKHDNEATKAALEREKQEHQETKQELAQSNVLRDKYNMETVQLRKELQEALNNN